MTNNSKIEDLEVLGVNPNISKLLTSKIERDFLIGWELIRDHSNCEYIRAYCKGMTATVKDLDYYWSEQALRYYNVDTRCFTFGDIIIKI